MLQGAKVRFSLPPDFDVMEKVIKAAEEMKATEMPEADALIIFSCAGRTMALGPLMQMEIEGIKTYGMYRWLACSLIQNWAAKPAVIWKCTTLLPA